MRARSARPGVYVLLALLAAAFAPAAALANDVGMVKTSRGAATIERAGQRLPAPAGTRVREGDALATGADGAIGVTFTDNTLLSLGPDSRLVVNRFTFDATTHRGAFETSLERGTLAGVSGQIAKQSPDGMKVRTPAALLGVRGTEFVLRTGEPAR